jgi:peptidoglycan/xylan/chitin deacetylase (PgdA/CDA1 family)
MCWGSVRFFKHLIYSILLVFGLTISVLAYNIICLIIPDRPESSTINQPAEAKIAPTTTTQPIQPTEKEEKESDILKPYQLLYPAMYGSKADNLIEQENTVYLTFDDGPSNLTPKVLEILKKNDIKATFFVVGKPDSESRKIMKRIVDEGHAIGVHSYSHDYRRIYQSVDAYLDDFYKMYNLIYEATGVEPSIFRFPGGSVNSYNKDIYNEIVEEMNRRGFTYYDWNVSSSDTKTNASVKSIRNNVLNGIAQGKRSIVLMHDSSAKNNTVAALDVIIRELKSRGTNFDILTNEVKPIVFKY